MPGRCMADPREFVRTWHAVLGRLELEVSRQCFDTWLRDTTPLHRDGDTLVVQARSSLALPWLNDQLEHIVRRALSAIAGEEMSVQFVEHASDDGSAGCAEPAPSPDASAHRGILGAVNPRYTLEHYVSARGNRLALDTCIALIGGEDGLAGPVAVWGGPGMGKTHLLHGLAQRAAAQGWSTACLNAEDFTSRYQGSLRNKNVQDFQEEVRNVQLFILDDLQYLAGKRATQDELVHTIDAVTYRGGQVVVAGELHPLELDLPARLSSRLTSGVVARIDAFELAERRHFVESVARETRAALPAWCIDRIAALGDVSLRLVQGAVMSAVALQRANMLDVGRLDGELARVAVTQSAPAAMTPDAIIEAVATHYDETAAAITGRARTPSAVNARAVTAAALKDQGLSLAEIARILGNRNRTTLSPVVTRGRKLLEANPTLQHRLAG